VNHETRILKIDDRGEAESGLRGGWRHRSSANSWKVPALRAANWSVISTVYAIGSVIRSQDQCGANLGHAHLDVSSGYHGDKVGRLNGRI
jgi:hypothetical protein